MDVIISSGNILDLYFKLLDAPGTTSGLNEASPTGATLQEFSINDCSAIPPFQAFPKKRKAKKRARFTPPWPYKIRDVYRER